MKRFNIIVAVISLVIDLTAVTLGLILAYKLRAGSGGELFQWSYLSYLRFIAWIVPIWIVLLATQGLYNIRNLPKGWNALGRIMVGLLSGWGVMIIILYLLRTPEALVFPRLLIIYGVILTISLCLIGRVFIGFAVGQLRRSGVGLVRSVILVGQSSSIIVDQLKNNRRHDRRVLAALKTDYINCLSKYKTDEIDELIVADFALKESDMLNLLDWAESHYVRFTMVPSVMSVLSTNVEMGELANTPVMYFRRTPLEGWGRVYKRIFDLIVVIPSIIVLSPVLVILFIIAQLSTGSGIIRQPRIGQDGKTFYIHKFRSMYLDWQKRFPKIKDWSSDESTDPRITSVGRILRKTDFDELAQLWDILIGTMSFVGPRPEQPKYVKKFAQEIPNYLKRHHVKSGLTGWAQINGMRGNTPVADRVKYDLYYIENWSIWFDIRIILATFIYVFRQAFRSNS